jgi:glycerol-3-phosphate responsive antiterminator
MNLLKVESEMLRLKALVAACKSEEDLTLTIASLIKGIREGEKQWRWTQEVKHLQGLICHSALKI